VPLVMPARPIRGTHSAKCTKAGPCTGKARDGGVFARWLLPENFISNVDTLLDPAMAIEDSFDISFVADIARREKQIQQNYRPVIGVHKWFARRPGTLFRGLILSEFDHERPLAEAFFRPHDLAGKTIADPFMGGGSPLIEANRLGCNVIGFDVNPMAYWIVRQELSPLDRAAFREAAKDVIERTGEKIARFYKTVCIECGNRSADVKYFLWIKQATCERCGFLNDLFPGYLLATNDRHTHYVVVCPSCTRLNQLKELPKEGKRTYCRHCKSPLATDGDSVRGRPCKKCGEPIKYPQPERGAPVHRMFGIEYHCLDCRDRHIGRYFKTPDPRDLRRFAEASRIFAQSKLQFVPDEKIPSGDESTRLLRWGYCSYRDLFSPRQLLGLNILAAQIAQISSPEIRFALATVFSDTLRYQNMLVRYDTWALKALDVFSVHGFPVSLVQCESNLLGIPKVGSGGFGHFVEKYDRAKAYCELPFETLHANGRKQSVSVNGEMIIARIANRHGDTNSKWAWLDAADAASVQLPRGSLDAVFTDPPYFANVQYAELMDFCYVWLRRLLRHDVPQFCPSSTRSPQELTGNVTEGRTAENFTAGLSRIFSLYASALKPNGPFVFTYHHNKLEAYLPIVVAILDAGLLCTAALPCPAEMRASIHINGTGSSVVDTIFVCRPSDHVRSVQPIMEPIELVNLALDDLVKLQRGGLRPTLGDARCIVFGHLVRLAIGKGYKDWQPQKPVAERLRTAELLLESLHPPEKLEDAMRKALACAKSKRPGQLALNLISQTEQHAEVPVRSLLR
jgi:adenine-specific DNA methylase